MICKSGLNSCSTGGKTFDGGTNFAQELADKLGVTVTAPTDLLRIRTDGNLSAPWAVFLPRVGPFR